MTGFLRLYSSKEEDINGWNEMQPRQGGKRHWSLNLIPPWTEILRNLGHSHYDDPIESIVTDIIANVHPRLRDSFDSIHKDHTKRRRYRIFLLLLQFIINSLSRFIISGRRLTHCDAFQYIIILWWWWNSGWVSESSPSIRESIMRRWCGISIAIT